MKRVIAVRGIENAAESRADDDGILKEDDGHILVYFELYIKSNKFFIKNIYIYMFIYLFIYITESQPHSHSI